MNDEKHKRGLVCMFCGRVFGYDESIPNESILKEAFEHEAYCYNNPYILKISRLLDAGRRLLAYIDDDDISAEDSAKLLKEMEIIFRVKENRE